MAARVRNVGKVFSPGTANEKIALRSIDFALDDGEFAVVIGSNGAGKSTLLNAVAGEVVIDTGEILIDGRNVRNQPVHRRASLVSRVFQDPMLGTAPGLSIEENLAIALGRGRRKTLRLGLNRRNREYFRERISVLGLGLENRLGEKVEFLSGGQRQSLTLVMASLVHPRLMLLDEHTSALDPRAAELVLTLTSEVVTEGAITTIMVTHNMQHALTFGDRLFMMHEGAIVLDVGGREKARLTVSDLVERFHVTDDKMLLSQVADRNRRITSTRARDVR